MNAKRIPISFAPARLAVNEEQLFELLGLNDGRSIQAKKKAVYRFLAIHGIKPLPGRVFPLRQIEEAVLMAGPE